MPLDADQNVPLQTMAQILGISVRRLQELAKEGYISKSGKGQYPLRQTVQAFVAHQLTIARPDLIDLDQARARKELALAEKTEHALAIDRKEYVHISHLEKILANFASAAAAKFDSIAARIHQKYPDLRTRHIEGIRKEIAEARNYVATLQPNFD